MSVLHKIVSILIIPFCSLIALSIGRLPIKRLEYTTRQVLKPSANAFQKSLNKCETQNEIVFHIRLLHSETINSELFRDSTHGKQNIVETLISDTFVDKEKHSHWSFDFHVFR